MLEEQLQNNFIFTDSLVLSDNSQNGRVYLQYVFPLEAYEAYLRQYTTSIWQPDATLVTSTHSKLKVREGERETLFA